jgi:hypothetical protein
MAETQLTHAIYAQLNSCGQLPVVPAPSCRAEVAVDHFSHRWRALRAAVAELTDEDFTRPSGCTGWLVRDLVCHLIIDAQDILITLVIPAGTEPTRNAVTYRQVAETPPSGDDPLDALIVRPAAAYEDPRLLTFHFDDVGSAAGRAADLADPHLWVGTRGEVLSPCEPTTPLAPGLSSLATSHGPQ